MTFCYEYGGQIPSPEEYVASFPDASDTEIDAYDYAVAKPVPEDTFKDKVVSFFSGNPTPRESYLANTPLYNRHINPNSAAPSMR